MFTKHNVIHEIAFTDNDFIMHMVQRMMAMLFNYSSRFMDLQIDDDVYK